MDKKIKPEIKSFFFTRKKELYRLDIEEDTGFSIWVSTPKGTPKSWRWVIDGSTLFDYDKDEEPDQFGQLGINTENKDIPFFTKLNSRHFRLNDRIRNRQKNVK